MRVGTRSAPARARRIDRARVFYLDLQAAKVSLEQLKRSRVVRWYEPTRHNRSRSVVKRHADPLRRRHPRRVSSAPCRRGERLFDRGSQNAIKARRSFFSSFRRTLSRARARRYLVARVKARVRVPGPPASLMFLLFPPCRDTSRARVAISR